MEEACLRMNKLSYLFEPHSVAVVGASGDPAKPGHRLARSIIDGGYQGKVYLVNPNAAKVLGRVTYPSIRDIPDDVDLAFIVIPEKLVPEAVQGSIEAHVKSLVVISGGFAETGEEGKRVQEELGRLCRNAGIPMVGPNSMGICCFPARLTACIVPLPFCEPGSVSFISQSGTYGTGALNSAVGMGVPFNKFVSSGNEAVIRFSDYVEYLGQDPSTKVIVGAIEGVTDGRNLLRVAKEVSKKKPIVVMKCGRTTAGARAVASHTGVLAGSHELFKGFCKQTGMIEVYRTEDLLNVARAFVTQPIPRGKKVGIVALGGGFGVALADFLIEQGLEVPELTRAVQQELRDRAGMRWYASVKNPVDLAADFRVDTLVEATEILLGDSNIDGVVVMPPSPSHVPNSMLKKMVKLLEGQWKKNNKPLLLGLIGGTEEVQKLSKVLPIYKAPEEAGQAMLALVEYGQFRRNLSG